MPSGQLHCKYDRRVVRDLAALDFYVHITGVEGWVDGEMVDFTICVSWNQTERRVPEALHFYVQDVLPTVLWSDNPVQTATLFSKGRLITSHTQLRSSMEGRQGISRCVEFDCVRQDTKAKVRTLLFLEWNYEGNS